jgi:hypothetical protein
MSQFNMIDSPNRPQRVAIHWEMRTPQDLCAGAPDSNDEGFWPSQDPDSPGYVLPENYEKEMRRARGRMAAWKAGRWHYVGVQAVARVFIPAGGNSFRVLTLESAGLWGIESNSGKYLREVYLEEKAGLMAELKTLGAAIGAGDYVEEESE